MTRSISNFGGLIALLLVLSGCSSTPSNNYYLLTAQEGANPGGRSPSLGIGPIEIAEYLNRNALVYRRAGNQVQIARFERWAEPLQDGVTRVLRLNLAQLLDTEDVRRFPWHPDRAPDYGVKVTILALDTDGTRASLEAEWLLLRPATAEAVRRRISRLEYQSASGELAPEQLPAAYSELLYLLSKEIADTIRADTGTPPI